MAYSESDTRVKLIDPKIKESNWSENNIVREYYFTEGRKFEIKQDLIALFYEFKISNKYFEL